MQHLQPNTTLQGGKYKIDRVLGQGGFGITYLARNTVFDIDVAIKEFFMKDENERYGNSVTMPNSTKTELFLGQKEKFKKEAKRMFAIKNEHIIGVHDLFEENDTAYYVMDYVDGENLSERLMRKGRPMDEQEVREILPQILDGLKSVHDAGIWHLDLKPSNVMIDKNGNAYLIDFGASKQIRANGNMTTSTVLCYTPGYAPNEQIGQMYDRFGPWTDIYALGATIYNIITNKKPPMAIDIEEDGVEAFEFPQTISVDMRSLVIWMMQPKRKERPQSTSVVLEKLIAKRDDEKKKGVAIETEGNEKTIVIRPKISKEILNSNSANICNGQKYVDLGLSVYWADKNIGASSPDQVGISYIWGDRNGWIDKETRGSIFKRLHNYKPQVDVISGNKQYDTAREMWGYSWRMPKVSDFVELVTKCKWVNMGNGHVKVWGPSGNYIILHVGPYWIGEKMNSLEVWGKTKNNQKLYRFWDRSRWNHLKTFCLIRPVIDKNIV